MAEAWGFCRLGDVVQRETARVGIDPAPDVLSSTKHQGLVPSRTYFKGRQIFSDDLSTYRLVQPSWFAYATNHLAEGSIGLNNLGKTGCVSPMYTVFSTREHVDEQYLYHLLKTPELLNQYQLHEQASVDRRGSVRFTSFAEIPIMLPSLEEQRRIAEILDTIDETIQATERVIAKRRAILLGLQESLLDSSDGATRTTIGSLVSGHWPGEWGEGVPSLGLREVIVLRATNLDNYGVAYSTGARRFVASLKVDEKRLMDGDLLIEAAGGGPGVPVGRVRRFRQPADDMPYLTSNFFRALRPRAGVDSDYLFWLLDREYRKSSIWSCQQQTTGIINLQVKDYLHRPVSFHQASQSSIVRTLNAALGTIEGESRHVQKLREARDGLAADLLSGCVRTVAP